MNKMSDDLISRKAALERLRLLRKFNPQEVMKVAVDAAEQQINFCGTAFDKDKVIDQLKVLSSGIILNTNISDDYAEGYVKAAKDMIAIVEKGRVE